MGQLCQLFYKTVMQLARLPEAAHEYKTFEGMIVLAVGCGDRVLDNNRLRLVMTTFGEFSPFLLLVLLALLGK